MNPLHLAVAVLPLAALGAQQGATTLARMAERADAVVRVRVLDVERDADIHVVLRAVETFRGDAPSSLVLTEPGARACGRALHGVLPGSSYVAFLATRRDGSWRLAGGGARSLVALEPGLLDHVRRLCAGPGERLEVLLAGLDSDSVRVRADAALALPTLPELHRADHAQRARLGQAVLHAVEHSEPCSVDLLTAAARLRLRELLPALLDRYLAGPQPLDVCLRRTIAGIDPDAAGRELDRRLTQDAAAHADRALPLLAELPAEHAAPALARIARSASRPARLRAGAAWLRAGLDRRTLAILLPAEEVAACAHLANDATRFRSIRRRPNR